MAIAFRSVSNGAGGANPTLTEPAGAASGDVLVCAIGSFGAGAVTGPAGWTKELDMLWAASAYRLSLWSIVRGASAPALGWTIAATTNVWEMLAYTGCHQTTPVDVAAAGTDNATSTTPSSPSLTTVTANAYLLCGMQDPGGASTITVPTGMTQRQNSTGNGEAVADLALGAAGATGTKQWTLSVTDVTVTWSIALRPPVTSVSVTPSTASVTLATFAPSVVVNTILTPAPATLALSTFAPSAIVNHIITPDTASLTLSAFAPSAVVNTILTPGIASVILTGYAPTVFFAPFLELNNVLLAFPNYFASIDYREYESALVDWEYSASADFRDYSQRIDAPNYTRSVNAG